jgi:YD repeat-containing protein
MSQSMVFHYYGVDNYQINGGPPGSLADVVDANGQVGHISYDPFGRKTREDLPGGLGWSEWRYNDNPSKAENSVEQLDATGAEELKVYDGIGRLSSATVSIPQNRLVTTEATYDSNGYQETVRGPYLVDSTSPQPRHMVHDEFGRLSSLVDAGERHEFLLSISNHNFTIANWRDSYIWEEPHRSAPSCRRSTAKR